MYDLKNNKINDHVLTTQIIKKKIECFPMSVMPPHGFLSGYLLSTVCPQHPQIQPTSD